MSDLVVILPDETGARPILDAGRDKFWHATAYAMLDSGWPLSDAREEADRIHRFPNERSTP